MHRWGNRVATAPRRQSEANSAHIRNGFFVVAPAPGRVRNAATRMTPARETARDAQMTPSFLPISDPSTA